MKIANITPGLLPIPPNGWGAVEKIIWEIHNNLLELGHDSEIKYLDQINGTEDIVHIHIANLANMAHERGIPYYFTFHDHHAFLYGKDSELYKENLQAIRNAKRAFVPAKYLIEYFDGIPEYLSHGVNTDWFTPNEFKEHKLLCVANNGFAFDQTEDRKGFGFAIDAAKRLGLPITIAGPSNNKNYFQKYSPDYDKLTILYDLSEEELRDLYKQHTIFLHPSVLEAGHPNLTLLEAMASGLPVVGTFEENNSINGMLYIERDMDSIVNAINYLMNDMRYLELKLSALEQAHELSWKNITKKLLTLYSKNESMRDILIKQYNLTDINPKPSLVEKPSFNINFIQGAFFEIKGGPDREYNIKFIDKKTGKIEHSGTIKKNCWIKANKSHFVDWEIIATDGDNHYKYNIVLAEKRVYIALDSKSLGDTLAWFPYVEEFRKKNNCHVICSTFHNKFFEENYPMIEFVNPGDVVHNLYAMYTIGWYYNANGEIDWNKNPYDFKPQPLQKTASDILGLEYIEVKPNIKLNPNIEKENIVSIAIHSTTQAKYWNNPTGWQEVVDYLKNKGYRVVLISKEGNGYMGNWYPTGIEVLHDNSLDSVIETLQKSKLFIGISSGLSWLSWAVGTKTCIISGFSADYTEMISNTIHINAPIGKCSNCFNTHRLDAGDWNWCPIHKGTERQFECSKSITGQSVIDSISNYI
jgi:autotransporter strand-loop-strand O-heptosyltransferase